MLWKWRVCVCDPCAGAKLCRGLGLSWLGTLGFQSSRTKQKRKTTKPSAPALQVTWLQLLISLLSLSAVFGCIRNSYIKVFIYNIIFFLDLFSLHWQDARSLFRVASANVSKPVCCLLLQKCLAAVPLAVGLESELLCPPVQFFLQEGVSLL